MFSQACVILFTGGCLPQCMLGYNSPEQTHTPQEQTPPRADTPPEQTHPWEQTPPRADTPPGADTPQSRHPPEQTPPRADPPRADTAPNRACWEKRSTRGRYTSYWNAILFIGSLRIKLRSLICFSLQLMCLFRLGFVI